jgi:hypothetical protein
MTDANTPLATQSYGYDGVNRLGSVAETVTAGGSKELKELKELRDRLLILGRTGRLAGGAGGPRAWRKAQRWRLCGRKSRGQVTNFERLIWQLGDNTMARRSRVAALAKPHHRSRLANNSQATHSTGIAPPSVTPLCRFAPPPHQHFTRTTPRLPEFPRLGWN